VVENASKLPRRLAAIGFAIPWVSLGGGWLVGLFNPVAAMAPSPFWDVAFALCPAGLLSIACMDCSGWAVPLVLWVIAAGINGLLYYWIGLGIVALVRHYGRGRG
jgi:hypothetical protein